MRRKCFFFPPLWMAIHFSGLNICVVIFFFFHYFLASLQVAKYLVYVLYVLPAYHVWKIIIFFLKSVLTLIFSSMIKKYLYPVAYAFCIFKPWYYCYRIYIHTHTHTGLDDIFLLPCEGLPQHVRFLQIPSQDFKVIIMTKESHAKA